MPNGSGRGAGEGGWRRVAVVGGGLAGLAAAAALGEAGFAVELFEARRRLGGRAGSFRDPQTGEAIDQCQHVSMGCCTNLADFSRRMGIGHFFRRDRVLHFFGPDDRRCDFSGSRWLPAPLHLAGGLWALKYLTPRERLSAGRALWRLARLPAGQGGVADEPGHEPTSLLTSAPAGPNRTAPGHRGGATIGAWLREQGLSERVIELFFSPIIVSALAESLERASLHHARQVFVEAFLSSRRGYEILVPRVPLERLYGAELEASLQARNVAVRLRTGVERIEGSSERVVGVRLADGDFRAFDAVVCAVAWTRCCGLFRPPLWEALTMLHGIDRIEASPITGIHLWFDRPITPLGHAVLVGRLTQWVFRRPGETPGSVDFSPHSGPGRSSGSADFSPHRTAADMAASPNAADNPGRGPSDASRDYYYQVVISASRELDEYEREEVIEEVCGDLRAVFPEARAARLVRWRQVSDPLAVFSVVPGIERHRPPQRTAVPNLFVAGDWTATGWPATMEGAVRSGYLAAEAILTAQGDKRRVLVDDLPRGVLARLLWGKKQG